MLGRHGRAAGVFVMAGGRLVWVAGQGKEGAGAGSPEGCYTITVRRHGAHMYMYIFMCVCVCVCFCFCLWVCEKLCMREMNEELDAGGEESTRGVQRGGCGDPAFRIWWSRTWC